MRALVVGSYGAGNIGDEATLGVIVQQLESSGYSVLYTNYERKDRKAVNIYSPLLLIKSVIRSDLIVFCGGMLSERMGPFQKLFPAIALFAKVFHKRLEFISVSFLKSQGILCAWFRLAIKQANYVSVRDLISRRNLSDVVLEHDLTHKLRAGQIPFPYNSSPKVGVALRSTKNVNSLLEALQWLLSEGAVVFFVPFCYHRFVKKENDYLFARKLRRLIANRNFRILRISRPEHVKYAIGKMDVVIASRFHALVFAKDQNVPVIPVVRDEKMRSFVVTYKTSDYVTPDTPLEAFKQVFQRVRRFEENKIQCVERMASD